MIKTKALRNYKKYPAVKEYTESEQVIYINENDEVLQKWKITLPESPEWHYIRNFGLMPRDQFFQYEEYPIELRNLENSIREEVESKPLKDESNFGAEYRIKNTILERLRIENKKYDKEIKWIQSQFWKRKYGEWQFINGTAYYISPWHWFYLNYWKLEGNDKNDGLPSFRYRDYKWFWAQHYLATTTETVDYEETKIKDKSGNEVIKKDLVILPDGTPRMKDMGVRTCFGSNNLKGRRVGESSKACGVNYEIATSKYDAYCGIQADTGTTAQQIYEKKLVYAYRELPFFFVPEVPNFMITKEINFKSKNFRGGLRSKIDWANSAESRWYDSERLDFYHGDEIGKTQNGIDVGERHEVVKRCMSPGAYINGFMIYTSTAENMDSESGKKFQTMSENSMFEKRGIDGRTDTGLVNVYFDICESYEGFLDRYGFPIIENPELGSYQIEDLGIISYNENGEIMGCREFLEYKKKELAKDGDFRKLAGFKRKNPSSFKECFALAANNDLFNSKLIQDRYETIKFGHDKILVGDMVWENGRFSTVQFIENQFGRFKVSMRAPDGKRSRCIIEGNSKRPMFNQVFIAGSDAFRYENTNGWRQSDGTGAVLYKHDPSVDSDEKPTSEWESKRFVCTYKNRPSKDEYCEDMLKMCIYYGAMMYPEMNIPMVADYFIKYGYSGYLLYDIDSRSGMKKNNPGYTLAGVGGTLKQQMFNNVNDFINLHINRCDHPEILEEMMNIPSPEYMRDYDIFAAVAGCLQGEMSNMIDAVKKFNIEKTSLDKWFPGYSKETYEDIL